MGDGEIRERRPGEKLGQPDLEGVAVAHRLEVTVGGGFRRRQEPPDLPEPVVGEQILDIRRPHQPGIDPPGIPAGAE